MQSKHTAISVSVLLIGALLVPMGVGHANLLDDPPAVDETALTVPTSTEEEEDEETTLLDISLGMEYLEDFNEDDGNWSANEYPEPERPDPRNPSWAWGAPTSGPGEAVSGTNVWATNLDGNFNENECAAIASPTIDLTDASTASVSFSHWFDTRASSFSGRLYDAGTLFVTGDGGETFEHVEPDDGYSSSVFWFPTRTCLNGASFGFEGFGGSSDGWQNATVNLDSFAGDEIQFVFAFGSSSSNDHEGWYVDDFEVTVDADTTTEDFESSDGGFTLMSTEPKPLAPQGFSWDTPTTGPDYDNALWATNPHGDYGPNECSWTESPPITVGEDYPNEANLIVKPVLSWEQWFRTNSGVGQGVVQVGTPDGEYVNIVPEGGYPGTTRFSKPEHDACLNQGEDEVFAGFHNGGSDPLTEYQADLSEWLGQEITIRFLFATSDSSLMNDGWFVDNVGIELRAVLSVPADAEGLVNDLLDDLPNPNDGSTPPGWSVGGTDPSWQYGVASDGPEGETVFMTNLEGDYNDDECGWAQTPPIPGALLAADPTLQFDHWYHTYLAFSSGPWSAGVVQVSTDGENWTFLDVDNYDEPITSSIADDCFEEELGMEYPVPGSFAGESGEFVSSTADLSDFVGAETVEFRFVFGTGISIGRPGWALQNVNVAGIPILSDSA